MTWIFSKAMMEACESLPSSPGQAGESSEESCSDGEPYAQLNVKPTQHKFWRNDKMMDHSTLSRFGLTLRLLTDDHGEAVLMSFLEAFPVRTSHQQERGQEFKGRGLDYGAKWQELPERLDRNTFSWKTRLSLFQEDLHWSSVTLPAWGMMLHGVCLEDKTLRVAVKADGVGFWPRPCANDGSSGMAQTGATVEMRRLVENGQLDYVEALRLSRGAIHNKRLPQWRDSCHQEYLEMNGKKYSGELLGTLHPNLYEWLMEWPIGWTGLDALETGKTQDWLQSPLNC